MHGSFTTLVELGFENCLSGGSGSAGGRIFMQQSQLRAMIGEGWISDGPPRNPSIFYQGRIS